MSASTNEQAVTEQVAKAVAEAMEAANAVFEERLEAERARSAELAAELVRAAERAAGTNEIELEGTIERTLWHRTGSHGYLVSCGAGKNVAVELAVQASEAMPKGVVVSVVGALNIEGNKVDGAKTAEGKAVWTDRVLVKAASYEVRESAKEPEIVRG